MFPFACANSMAGESTSTLAMDAMFFGGIAAVGIVGVLLVMAAGAGIFVALRQWRVS